MSQGSFSPKIRFLGQKVSSVARRQTGRKVKMVLKIPFFKISKNKKMRFFLMSQGSFSPKIRLLGQKVSIENGIFKKIQKSSNVYGTRLSDPWDMRKKNAFFRNFRFYAFYRHFSIFPYITLVNFWFQASGHSFTPRIVIFGLSERCTIENWRLLKFFENSIFYG